MNVKLTLVFALAIISVAYVVIQLYPTLSNVGMTETINMVANDTEYALTYNPIYLSAPYVPTLTFANGTSAGNYTFTTSTVRTGFNIVPGNKVATYTYYKQPWLGGTNYLWVVASVVFIGLIAVILKFVGAI